MILMTSTTFRFSLLCWAGFVNRGHPIPLDARQEFHGFRPGPSITGGALPNSSRGVRRQTWTGFAELVAIHLRREKVAGPVGNVTNAPGIDINPSSEVQALGMDCARKSCGCIW